LVVLIHIANVLYVISYLVKEILWLRLLTVVAGSVLIAYYALLPVPLWAAIGWNVVFLAINLRQIQVLLLERRPVRLSPDELRLYQLAFRSLTQCEFAKLLRIARGEDVAADQRIVTHGQGVNRIMVIAEGRARVEIAGAPGRRAAPRVLCGGDEFPHGTDGECRLGGGGEDPSRHLAAERVARIFRP
jgi:hypothetical protein